MTYEIIAIVIGPLVAVFTVYLEYRKDKKEKLQDRKDMWLDIHFKDITNELVNLKCFNQDIEIGSLQLFLNEKSIKSSVFEKNKFETRLVFYMEIVQDFFDGPDVQFGIIDTNKIKNNYDNSIKHLESGYENTYKNMVDLWNAELVYKNYVVETIGDILKNITRVMRENFSKLKASIRDNEPSSYNITQIFWELVRNALGYKVNINFKVENKHSLFFENNTSAFIHLLTIDAEKFINEVWDKLKTDSQKDLENLINYNKRILDKESIVQKSILGIIDLYVAGHVIEGYCDVCGKIYHEKDITKLRPKL